MLLTLFVLLPLPHQAFNWALLSISLAVLYDCFRRKQFLRLRFGHWFLPCLFFYFVVSIFATGGKWSDIERYFLIIGIPLLFSNLPIRLGALQQRRIYLALIAGCLAAFILCVFRALFLSFSIQEGELIFNPSLAETSRFDFLVLPLKGGNRFFSVDLSFILHPTYFGMLIVLALCLIFEMFVGSTKKLRVFFLGSAVVLLLALFLLSSKAAMLSFGLVTVVWILQAPVSWRYRAGVLSLLLVVALVFVKFNPRMAVFLQDLSSGITIKPEAEYGHDLRLLSWDAGVSLFRENFILGVGESNKEGALLQMYDRKSYIVPLKIKLNTHNQFLDFAVGGGIVGLGIFLFGIIHLFYMAIKWKDHTFVAFLTVFVFNMLFENILSRNAGILFFVIFVSFFINRNLPKTDFKTANDV